MHAAVFGFFSTIGVIGFCVVLFHSGFQQPEALIGALIVAIYFGRAAAKEFRYEKRKSADAFLAESNRITAVLLDDSDLRSVLTKLGSDYRIAADASGFSLKNGRCRVVDLIGPATQTRLEIKADRIRTHDIPPPYGK